MTTMIRPPGDFCWINMLTPEPKEACDFFAAVLGWTYGEIPGMGYTIKAGGRDNGGAGPRADYSPTYYAAFLIDPDGNNVEADCP